MKTITVILFVPLAWASIQNIESEYLGIHATWNEQLQKFVDHDGKVNYKAWKEEQGVLVSYIEALQKMPPEENWTKNKKLAYWINAYNALTVRLILEHYPVKSIKNIEKPWDINCFFVEGGMFSLGEIEHDILRKMEEPRIHFAINCASASCPKLLNKAYTEKQLEAQLEMVTKDFLQDPKRNTIVEGNWKLSKIFLWFSKDFGSKAARTAFVNKYLDTSSLNPTIKYLPYDWSLNE